MSAPDLSVVIFAFNEEANIVPVLTELRAWLDEHEPSAEIVFVDDGSSDGTSAEAIAPDAIGKLRAAAADEAASVVFSVYDHRDDGFHRKILSAGVRGLIILVHGVRMQSDGPYLFRHELFDADALVPDTFFLNFEFPIRMLGAGVPTTLKRIVGVAQDLLDLRVRRTKEALGRHP
ncbi:MAG: hypothetical protein AMJ63_10105 [Myxococcales bacterium SG8_38_1]|nr:MAG: hypothetical protein AMJ63_10105 [Myxococcales bacterium SG8_38_1]